MFQRVPDGLRRNALLRIHPGGFNVGNPEESRIETIDVGDKAAVPHVGLAHRERIGIVMRVDVPSFGWDLGDAIAAFAQGLEQSLNGGDASGQSAANADDRYRLFRIVRNASVKTAIGTAVRIALGTRPFAGVDLENHCRPPTRASDLLEPNLYRVPVHAWFERIFKKLC